MSRTAHLLDQIRIAAYGLATNWLACYQTNFGHDCFFTKPKMTNFQKCVENPGVWYRKIEKFLIDQNFQNFANFDHLTHARVLDGENVWLAKIFGWEKSLNFFENLRLVPHVLLSPQTCSGSPKSGKFLICQNFWPEKIFDPWNTLRRQKGFPSRARKFLGKFSQFWPRPKLT